MKRFKHVLSLVLCLVFLFAAACTPKAEYTVVFMPNIDNTNVKDMPGDQSVKEGKMVTEPTTAPSLSGHTFGGWYMEKTCTNKFDFNAPVKASMLANANELFIYAKWDVIITIYHEVSFNLNYETTDVVSKQSVAENTRASEPSPAPSRSGWHFEGWYTSTEGTTKFNFTTPITAETTLFAKWTELVPGQVSFALDWNYPGASSVEAGDYNRIYNTASEVIPAEPSLAIPVRPKVVDATGYTYDKVYEWNIPEDPTDWASWTLKDPYEYEYDFVGWTTKPDSDTIFTDWGGAFTGDLTLYAQWKYMYTFEAEYVDLNDFVGNSVSGNATGREGVLEALNGEADAYPKPYASNGYFMSYLYKNDLSIWFDITSDRDTTAVLWVRMSGEMADDIIFDDDQYTITVNDTKVEYGTIEIPVFGLYAYKDAGAHFPFKDYVGVEVSLVKGDNHIVLTTTNDDMMGGGGLLPSIAPMVDCIKFDTTAKLSWKNGPEYYNLGGFLGENWWH